MPTPTESPRWHVPAGVVAVGIAVVAAILGTTPAATSQTEPAPACHASELTVSGPLLAHCGGGGR